MFGRGTAELFEQMPSLDGLGAAEARRMLSTAYLDILAARAEGERRSGPDRANAIDYLRRLANTIESYAIFDGRQEGDPRDGAAFVAAEALAFVSEVPPPAAVDGADSDDLARRIVQRTALLVEASLLYLIAGFETNGATLLSQELGAIPGAARQNRDLAFLDWTLTALVALCRLDTRARGGDPPADPSAMVNTSLASGVRAALLQRLAGAVYAYLDWLRGDSDDGVERARQELEGVQRVLAATKAHQHADIFHLARVTAAAITATAPRAVRTIPAPNEDASVGYGAYLLSRAKGSPRTRPRPVLWPAAQEYVQRCLPGPHSHAVVSVPTGAGKSFLAEIAVSQGLATGWALYLVPTNALANQVRHDLERAFEGFEDAQVRAFLGGDEYTTLGEEHASNVPTGTVVVMTPEKCALALRLAPEAFATCRVCVFDECHLLSDGTRGVLAELVVSHIVALAPACRFVLMSAMMANPDDVSNWLAAATGSPSVVVRRPWRPTRTMRGVVGGDVSQATEAANTAWNALVQPAQPSRGRPRVRMPFGAEHVVVANLQGAWSETSAQEYALVRLPTRTEIAVRRNSAGRGELDPAGWVNGTAAALTAFLAAHKFSVLTFLPSNRHHCFSVASDVQLPDNLVAERQEHELVDALLVIAEDELGVESVVGQLIRRRLSVHTSALLDSEKIASEVSFQDGVAVAMFATGTLAQGLNLPASVVVIGGTAVGDRREANTPEGRRRTRSQLLNALGRAGRAGFANHGLALVVTDQPIFFGSPPDTQSARQDASFLIEEDDSTVVDSRLQAFVEAALGSRLNVETASAEELMALSYLPIDPVGEVGAEQILSRSYAVHRRAGAADEATRAAAELVRVERAFVQQVGAPDWVTSVAYKTGLPFLLCLRVHQALTRVSPPGTARPTTLQEWRTLFFRALSYLPPQRAREVLIKEVKSAALAALWDVAIQGDNPNWDPPAGWIAAWAALEGTVSLYMAGDQLAALARRLFAIAPESPVDPGRTDGRKPVPRTIDFVNDLLERLSRVAGVLVAIDESAVIAGNGDEPAPGTTRALSELPLALRYGCSTRSVLAWFRFGIRFRRPAHALSRRFPLPDDVLEDSEVQGWVRTQRATWLREQDAELALGQESGDPVLNAARVVLTA